VLVLMVLVVRVFMVVLHGLMDMGVRMLLGQMQPTPPTHQQTGRHQACRETFAAAQCQGRTKEWRHRKVGPSSCCSQVAQAHHEQSQAHAIGQKAHRHGAAHERYWRPRFADHRGKTQIRASRNQAFGGGDPGGVVKGELAGEVVVDALGQAGAKNRQG